MVNKYTLPNGLRVVTEKIDYVQSASIGLWIGVGARDECDENRGISHAIEHMVFKGTPLRNNIEISETIDFAGGYINAFTDNEITCYYVNVMSKHAMLGLDVLSDMVLNALFGEEELKAEKLAIIEEIKQHEDEPSDSVFTLMSETIYPNHNLGRPILGYRETVSALTSDDMRQYKNSKYTPDSIVISVVGNIDEKAIISYVTEFFGHLTGSIKDWKIPFTTPVPVTNITVKQDKPIQQTHLCIAVPAYSTLDTKKYPLIFLDTILGGSMSSRLFQEVREKRGLAYSVSSISSLYTEGGAFVTYAGLNTENLDEAIAVIRDEFYKMTTTPISQEELERINNQLCGSLVLGTETMAGRMMRLGKNELIYGMEIPIEEAMRRFEAVTSEDIQACAQELLQPENYLTAIVGP